MFDNAGQSLFKDGKQKYGNNFPIPLDIEIDGTNKVFYEAPEDYYGDTPLILKYSYFGATDKVEIKAYTTENCVGKSKVDSGSWVNIPTESTGTTIITSTSATSQNNIHQLDLFYWDPAQIILDWDEPGTIGRIKFTFFFYNISGVKHMVVWKELDFDPFDFIG